MSTITKLSHHECSICHKCYTNKKLVAKCEVQCLEKVYKEINNIQSSSTLEESTNMSIDKNITPSYDIEYENSMENDLAIMDVTENAIDNTPSQLVYDFSAPVPVSGYDNAKNLKLMKIIKDTSNKILYRACSSYLGTKLLSRFLGVHEETYHVCCNGCMLYNNNQQTECPHCDEAHYKTSERSQDAGENPIPASTMIPLPLGRQLAAALANDCTRKEMLYCHHHTQKADSNISDVFDKQAYQSKKHLFSGENNIIILLSVDGFAPHCVLGLVTIVHVTTLNLPPMICYEHSHMIQVTIIPGPKAPATSGHAWSLF
ncbi:hypothetical protein PHYBLDRAFT_145994 [Phycomyces blakesleeanus NRRL 1555(-)]|uniref:Uncharacterized protein n=1 Tax=Phycomyces blakesleeanus (strain ATCC 8743b / DSM 1359 / FGSC 10004 / NBRC 33097 / NRRL 1555) TaxID=763407 RepID=A0A162NAS8_PHYB8|nr:hypothetical protein PHYBLDRAFT_145994 [Phycomyces blakesleeanus NRRL 1555(-)]OAD72678.1 hypothetical protein PHYBLDRAFT_145994 [Phycomyces blakesleeanus NRRL 1555(-)]|eukprot:XP_018290718.1 hypothetical protein PHYBLDRAFT_145994 [Phycomyces blakesleeanus NRRL 1555(-)]